MTGYVDRPAVCLASIDNFFCHFLNHFQHVCKLWQQWLFYDLKKSSSSKSISQEELTKLFKYLGEITSHVANCNIDNFHFEILSACL
jgi:hypothetical protein